MTNWDDFRYCLAVARSGTVSAASRALQVSHATVLRRIDQMEQELGVKLFKRLQSGYVLSAAGEVFLRRAGTIEADILDMVNLLQGHDEKPGGVLRVTQPQNVLVDFYPVYEAFLREYPDIRLEVETESAVVNLNRQDSEVAIRVTERPPELLVGRKLGELSFSAYASARYLARFDVLPQLAELAWIVFPQSVNNWGGLGDNSAWAQLQRQIPASRVVLQTANCTDMLSAMRAGIGASFISQQYASQFDDLVLVPGCTIHSHRELWILTHRDLRGIRRVQCFMRFVGDALADILQRGADAPTR
jgi:DNA-binding transcriptional LysR family regulator